MNYTPIDDYNIDRLKVLIKWLFEEVCSSGGDGDGIWYSKYYKVPDIRELIMTENLTENFIPKGWKIIQENNEEFSIGHEQECLIITNDKNTFDNRPFWQQVSLCY